MSDVCSCLSEFLSSGVIYLQVHKAYMRADTIPDRSLLRDWLKDNDMETITPSQDVGVSENGVIPHLISMLFTSQKTLFFPKYFGYYRCVTFLVSCVT